MRICFCFINVLQRGYKILVCAHSMSLELFCPAGKNLMNFIVCFKIYGSLFFCIALGL